MQADIVIGRAERMLATGLFEDAARSAYLACFHVAQALIFERTGRTAKSHHGVQVEFFRLSREAPDTDPQLRKFLSEAYEFKSVADYAIGADAILPAEEAAGAVATARRFMAHFGKMIV